MQTSVVSVVTYYGLSTFTTDDECQVICNFGLVVAFFKRIPVDKDLCEMANVSLLHDVSDRSDN